MDDMWLDRAAQFVVLIQGHWCNFHVFSVDRSIFNGFINFTYNLKKKFYAKIRLAFRF